MKITTRLMAVLCVVAALSVIWTLYVQRSAQQQAELVLSVNINSKNTGFDRIIKLEGAHFEAFVYDFSRRDDFFAFMQNPEKAWADEHLADLLPSYKLSGVWIYDNRYACVYAAPPAEGVQLSELPIRREALSKLLGQRYFHHFFMPIDAGMLEVRCAPIQSRDDWERNSPPRGFLFMGRLWSAAYIEELSALTESSVSLRPIVAGVSVLPPSFDLALGIITFSRILQSWDEQPIAELSVRSEVSMLRELALSLRGQFLQLMTFFSIILVDYDISF
jgi:hypothetical protein